MGGNALSKESTRIPAKDFDILATKLVGQLQTLYPGHKINVIQSYVNKPDHGDMDILIESCDQYNALRLGQMLGASEVVTNGDCTSIGIDHNGSLFQVDLIKATPKDYDFSLQYFAMNDLGNLLGRVAHKARFRLGHKGLYYSIYEMRPDGERSTEVVDKILVTQDWNTALEFLGFDAGKFQQGLKGGFKELTDIYEYVTSGLYFNSDIFLLENRNAAARVRDAKRKTYMGFLDWIAQPGNVTRQFDWSNKQGERTRILEAAFMVFPEFHQEYKTSLENHLLKNRAKDKFNGDIVSNITGLVQKELGLLMKSIREEFVDGQSLNKWMVEHSEEDISNFILGVAKKPQKPASPRP